MDYCYMKGGMTDGEYCLHEGGNGIRREYNAGRCGRRFQWRGVWAASSDTLHVQNTNHTSVHSTHWCTT